MAGEKVTATQVAERAGVSQSAVSRVFTPGASVSRKTAEKVRKVADEMGYRPNVLARSLITGRSRIIGVVVAYFENQFYPDAVEKLSNALQREGYHVLIFMASQTAGNIDGVLDEIIDYQVDGLIMASVAMSSELAERCEAAGIPVVLFNRSQDGDRVSAVTSNNVAGGRKMAEFLLAGGHRRIAHIAGWEGASTQRDRERGFVEGLRAAGQDLFDRTVGDFHFDSTMQAARDMFAKDQKPDAVFVANDHMAFAVMDVVRTEFGLRVPEDVSIVGYDDVPIAAWPSYDLTTIRQRSNIMVEETIDLLLTQIEDVGAAPRHIAVDGPLIVRSSARKPEGWNK